MLDRKPFIVFATGFVLALLFKQSITLFVDWHNNRLNFVMVLSFTIYVMIQVIPAWLGLQGISMDSRYNYFQTFSGFLYSISLLSTLYISMNRYVALHPTGRERVWLKACTFPVIGFFFAVRAVRTFLIFFQLQNPSTLVLPITSLQLFSLTPILLVRVLIDVGSLLQGKRDLFISSSVFTHKFQQEGKKSSGYHDPIPYCRNFAFSAHLGGSFLRSG
jgi:hypothetical protein